MPSRAIGKSKKPVLYYDNCSATILFGDVKTNSESAEADNHQIKSKYDRLTFPLCEIRNKIIRINSKRLLCICCKELIYLQCSHLNFAKG